MERHLTLPTAVPLRDDDTVIIELADWGEIRVTGDPPRVDLSKLHLPGGSPTIIVPSPGPIDVWPADSARDLVAQGLSLTGDGMGAWARGAGIGIRQDIRLGEIAGEPSES